MFDLGNQINLQRQELLITCILNQGGAASPTMKVWWKGQSYCWTDVVLMGWQKLLMPLECILGFPLLHLTQPLHIDWQQYPFGNSKCNHPPAHAYLTSSRRTGCKSCTHTIKHSVRNDPFCHLIIQENKALCAQVQLKDDIRRRRRKRWSRRRSHWIITNNNPRT